jgi:hypothetical protein
MLNLILGFTEDYRKVAGAAQKRNKNGLLIEGYLSRSLWQAATGNDPRFTQSLQVRHSIANLLLLNLLFTINLTTKDVGQSLIQRVGINTEI